MAFDLIDLEHWERREHYEHFIKEVVCGYSMTVYLDITNLTGYRLYPAMIWLLTYFDISMIPWVTFSAFNLHVFGDGKYLLPIFTLGKTFEDCGRRILPMAMQVHHAVCDGYHAGLFVEALRENIHGFNVKWERGR